MNVHQVTGAVLAAKITHAASRQTYYTIRFLVDPDRRGDAYRAYAYFRWVDDWLDKETRTRSQRMAFVRRQVRLVDSLFRGEKPDHLNAQENLLAQLVQNNGTQNNGLEMYIRGMMNVMAFDADRRGRLISAEELTEYTGWLASAVTEAMHYFIGHDDGSPKDDTRYQAVSGAHIVHMLRDTLEDIEAGYFNLPRERARRTTISKEMVAADFYRAWVKENAAQARQCFKLGRQYLARVENIRCRIAGYAYMYRFEIVLRFIEREGYLLREQYPERKTGLCCLQMLGWALWMAVRGHSAAAQAA